MMFSVCIIFLLSSTTINQLCNAQDVDSCVNGVCQGVEGDEVVIPCGDQPIDNATYTYYNYTSKYVILRNSNDYLIVNLTAFMDNTQIHCVLEDSHTTNYYTYTLSVLYAPQELEWVNNPFLRLSEQYDVYCPLSANPQPSCSWKALNCFNNSISLNMTEYGMFAHGCKLHIPSPSNKLQDVVCLYCEAVNSVGSGSFVYNSLQISACPLIAFIVLSPQLGEESNVVLEVAEGDSVNITCSGYGFGTFGNIMWCFNNTIDNDTCYLSENTVYDKEHCEKSSILALEDIQKKDEGTYRCYVQGLQAYEEIEVQVISLENNNEEFQVVWFTSVRMTAIVATLSIVFLALFVSFIATAAWKGVKSSHNSSVEFAKLVNDNNCENDEECEFDAFISFAEEDKQLAVEYIKTPLECKGYSICWHHDAFIPGYSVNENMEYFVYRSRYTIALMSQAFFDSAYCEMELEIARRKVLKTNRNCLIPVMVKPWEGIPEELLKVTYISIEDQQLLQKITSILGKCKEDMNITAI